MIPKNAVLGLAVASLVLGVAGREARALTFTLNDTTHNVSATAGSGPAPGLTYSPARGCLSWGKARGKCSICELF